MNKTQILKILKLLLIVIAIVEIINIIFYHTIVTKSITTFIEKLGLWAYLVVFLFQLIQVVFIPIPAYFITITSMKMFPNSYLLLFIVTLSALMLGTVIAYFIGLKWGKKAVVWAAGNEEEYEKWSNYLNNNGKTAYALSILLPVFPDDIMCIICGSIKMNFWYFFIANLICRAIGLVSFMFVFGATGNALTDIIIFGTLLIVILIVYLVILFKKDKPMKRNLLLIGEDLQSIATDIWNKNTNYIVLECKTFPDEEGKEYIREHDCILTCSPTLLEQLTTDELVYFCKKYKIVPIFITKDNSEIYLSIEKIIPDSIQYIINEENKDYDVLIDWASSYLFKRK